MSAPSDMPERAGDDDLTDEQIESLLARATERIKAKRANPQDVMKLDEKGQHRLPKLDKDYLARTTELATLNETPKHTSTGLRKVENPQLVKQQKAEQKKATAGGNWFDMPATNLTPELKRDLQLIKMRGVLDPHRHYKKDGGKMKPPEYSQVGTIVEGPTEFFSGRIENKQRKKTFVEEVLAGEQETGRFKRKYGELQTKKTSGKKAYYNALKEKRRGGVKKAGK
ncbi:dTDP-fucopyranose mutase [Saxophila tyrrhenica]|uniref:dTDP-fucopyranose mutase n=1 Tax=Saxophila tyrrhenica TaxID=1690608 RepID=A0AAV9P4V3_9PEZI|nr:dTDP-fucopyranose mutase [Saxophila tyrrhenica]